MTLLRQPAEWEVAMKTVSSHSTDLPLEQQAIRDKCFHPSGTFIEFEMAEIDQSIPDRFEQQVERDPDRVAIHTNWHQTTYKELNQAANQVTHAILARRRSWENQRPVALLFEQNASLTSGILGVLKAGDFYVPVDLSYPLDRITDMLQGSGTGLTLTDDEHLPLVEKLDLDGCDLLNIDHLENFSNANPDLSISPEDLAYLLYTSGSTGRPKGVVQNHRNVLHMVKNETNASKICAEDRLTVLYRASVVGAARVIFGGLLNGATLFPFNVREDGMANLASHLLQENITFYNSTPSVFRQMADHLPVGEKIPALRLIHLGGEAVSSNDVALYRRYTQAHCVLVSGFGATEISPVLRFFMDHCTTTFESIVPVGYPFEGIGVELMDDLGEGVEPGRIGEIVIQSRYLCLGYREGRNLNTEAFQPDPEGGDRRIYRTGDLGRIRPDGCVEHLGRNDSQVKIRGYRVEVTEIERVLVDLDGVKEAVIVPVEGVSGGLGLAAYIVPARKAPTARELRRILATKLPDYMMPATFMILDALPQTPSGKVDRKALPAPFKCRPELDSPFAEPRTPFEETLVEIWSQILGLNGLGIHDNFLELGGDSLLASQVVSRVVKTFQVDLPLRLLFESPTVADMAVAITQNRAKKAEQEDLDRMLAELEALSEEQARRLLTDENESGKAIDV